MGLEENLSRNMFSRTEEKTYIDKLLAKKGIERTKELISKDRLTRSEILELMHTCSSEESKLWNFGEWSRYTHLKFYVWIAEFIKIIEIMFDQEEKLNKGNLLSEKGKILLENNMKLIEHNAKFLVSLYFNIARTTLSLNGTGFIELLKNKFEMAYPFGQPGMMASEASEKRSIGNLWGLRKSAA